MLWPPICYSLRVIKSKFCAVQTVHCLMRRSDISACGAESAVSIEAALGSDDEGSVSRPKPALDEPPTLSEFINNSFLQASIIQMLQEETRRIHPFDEDRLLINAAKDALSYTFQNGYKQAEDSSENSSSYFVETILTEIVQRCVLKDLFEQNLEN